MLQTAADVAAMYAAVGERITPTLGAPFYGAFAVADLDAFDASAQAGDYALRCAASVPLSVGALLTIRGAQYRVAADPQRIADGLEVVVRLRKVAV